MRHVFLLILLWATACAPVVRPMGPAVGDPFVSSDALTARDGVTLPLKSWLPGGKPRAVIVGLHGFNDYSNALALPAAYWADRDIATYAYDQRGFGAAPEARIWGNGDAMAADARAVLALLARRHPGLPIYLLGDSMGAAVAVLAMAGPDIDGATIEGVILVAPGLWGGPSMHPVLRLGLWLSAHTMPWNTATGSGLKRRASDNIAMLRALGRDEKVIRHTRIDAVYGVTQLMGRAFEAAPGLKLPTLILYGERDEIVPAGPIQKTIATLPKAPDFALYPEGWHMLLRDLQAKVVWADIAAWIHDPAAPLPSGAQQRAQ